MRTLIKRLTSKTLLVNESSGANEPLLKGDRKGSPLLYTGLPRRFAV